MERLIDPSEDALMMNTRQTTTTTPTTTVVIGATGKTGRRVAERMSVVGSTVRAASRSGEVHFDWNDRTTWTPALTGADAAYITYYPDLALPGAADVVGAFAELAVAHDVRRLVLLSGRGEEGARLAEQRVQDSGADWTLVRCAFFNQNFDEAFADAIRAGVLAVPGGQTVEPFLDADDIADVVVAALTDERHIGQLYELTGPRLMSFGDVATELSAVLGHEVRRVPLSTAEFTAELIAAGFPEGEAVPIAELFAEVLDGRNSHLTDGVMQALGREPRDFADYARDAAATGVWDRAGVPS
ncbi:MAG: NAD(P)H-binding protein [Acidimicrobiales bacterium]